MYVVCSNKRLSTKRKFYLVVFFCAELSSLLPVVQLCEALLRLEKGPHLLARLIANMPDTFDQGDHNNSLYTVFILIEQMLKK